MSSGPTTHPTGGAGTGPKREAGTELEQEWLTPTEVAKYARCGRVKVNEALRSGELHGHQPKWHAPWKIRRSAVDAWIQGVDSRQAANLCGCAQLRPVRRIA